MREHWSKKYKREKVIKQAIIAEWRSVTRPRLRTPVAITLTRIAPRSFDFDNLVSSQKKARDVLADILIPGLAPGRADDSPALQFIYKQEKGAPKEYALKIEIQEV